MDGGNSWDGQFSCGINTILLSSLSSSRDEVKLGAEKLFSVSLLWISEWLGYHKYYGSPRVVSTLCSSSPYCLGDWSQWTETILYSQHDDHLSLCAMLFQQFLIITWASGCFNQLRKVMVSVSLQRNHMQIFYAMQNGVKNAREFPQWCKSSM